MRCALIVGTLAMLLAGSAGAQVARNPRLQLDPRVTTMPQPSGTSQAPMRNLVIKSPRNSYGNNSFEIVPAFTLACPASPPPSGQTMWITTCSTAVPNGTRITIKGTKDTGLSFVKSTPLKTGAWSGCDSAKDDTCILTLNSERTIFVDY